MYDHFRTSWIVLNDEPARPDPTWPDPTRPGPAVTLLDGLLLKKVWKVETEILKQYSFNFPICAIKIWNWYLWYLKNYGHFRKVAISLIFSRFFNITFDWDGNFEFWWFHRKDLNQIHQNIPYFKFKNIFFHP